MPSASSAACWKTGEIEWPTGSPISPIRAGCGIRLLPLVLLHVGVVLGQCRREGVAAVALGNEIEKRRLRGVGDGGDRVASGVADRPGGQAGVDVGVVRRLHL